MTPDADRGEELYHECDPGEYFDLSDDELLDVMATIRAATRERLAAGTYEDTGQTRKAIIQFEALYRIALRVMTDDR